MRPSNLYFTKLSSNSDEGSKVGDLWLQTTTSMKAGLWSFAFRIATPASKLLVQHLAHGVLLVIICLGNKIWKTES